MVRDKGRYLDIMKKYMDKSELDRVTSMLDSDSFTDWYMRDLVVQELPQNCSATALINDSPSAEEGYPVCTVHVSNRGSIDENLTLVVSVNGNYSFTQDFIAPVGKTVHVIQVPVSDRREFSKFNNESVECQAVVNDASGRELTSTVSTILPTQYISNPIVKTDLSLIRNAVTDENGDYKIGRITVKSEEKVVLPVKVIAFDDDGVLMTSQLILDASGSKESVITIPSSMVSSPTSHVRVEVQCRGDIIASDEIDVEFCGFEHEEVVPVRPLKNIFCEVAVQPMMDIYENNEGEITLALLKSVNNDVDSETLDISLILDGKTISEHRVMVGAGETTKSLLSVSAKSICFEDSRTCDLVIQVNDYVGNNVFNRSKSILIRSKFDIDLKKIVQRTAEFVNPHDIAVKKFVTDIDGPLSKAMRGSYEVSGYQCKGSKVLTQLEGVYRALRDYNMAYVSDVTTVDDGTTHYQRVRMPYKVLSDHTGNCIELSILFASIFEVMDFEPVVIFPPGHAIVGIVVGTDLYPSGSCISGKDLGDYVIRLGVGGKSLNMIAIEATMCSDRTSTVYDAMKSGKKTVGKNLDYIFDNARLSLIPVLRSKGVQPILW